MTNLIEGFGGTGFRSLNGPIQMLPNLKKMNFVAGRNNAGKSNVLQFAVKYLQKGASVIDPTDFDVPLSPAPEGFQIFLGRTISDEDIMRVISEKGATSSVAFQDLHKFLNQKLLRLNTNLVWFRYIMNSDLRVKWYTDLDHVTGVSAQQLCNNLIRSTNSSPGDNTEKILGLFDPMSARPEIKFIKAFRQITTEGTEEDLHNGAGLVAALQKLERPRPENWADKEKFEAINRFVQNVTEDATARLGIPWDAKGLTIERENTRALPLANFGTGIHQVVILAAAASLYENTFICMEEPEVHLNPLLQRKLIQYLNDFTNNQYLIATHSATLLDYERANIFHAQLQEGRTIVTPAGDPNTVSKICSDLGYRPSDLLQTNSIIWVEGPSDKIYLRHWIECVDPTLVEGMHYSIMFYGGSLISHLSGLDSRSHDLILLRKLNRKMAILIDSDKESAQAPLTATKIRVKNEFDADEETGFSWITQGYTIENYIPRAVLDSAFRQMSKKYTLTWQGQQWENPLVILGSDYAPSKTRLAVEVCKIWNPTQTTHQPLFDLLDRINQTVQFIRRANGLS